MKNVLVQAHIESTHTPKVDQNKRFLKMVKINIMLDDKGG